MDTSPPANPNTEMLNLLKEWGRRAWRFSVAHHRAATHYHRMHLTLGIPVVLVTAVLGTSAVSSMRSTDTADSLAQIVVVLLAVGAAILAGLQTFLNYGETAEKHRRAGGGWEALRWSLEECVVTCKCGGSELKELGDIRARMDSLQKESPTIPDWIWRLALSHVANSKSASPFSE